MQMVVQRELLVASRRTGSYWARVLAGGFATLALLPHSSGIRNGRELFFTAIVLGFVACVFEGVRRAAGSIANEKEQGTLGLLLLTPLTGAELLRGKFAAIGISAFQTALAVVPILAASLLLGGISAGEFLRAMLGLGHALTLAIFLGLIASTKTSDAVKAMSRTWALLGVCAALLTAFGFASPPLRPINPMTPLVSISDREYRRAPLAFWISILLSQTFVWSALRTYGRRLVGDLRVEQEKAISAQSSLILDARGRPQLVPKPVILPGANPVASGPDPKVHAQDSPRWFKEDPIEWFTLRDMRMHSGRIGAFFITLVAAWISIALPPVGVVLAVVGVGTLIISLCITSARSMANLRQSGFLPLLITTPLGERGVLGGHRRGLRRMFFWPFVMTSLAIVIVIVRMDVPRGGEWLVVCYFVGGFFLLGWATPWIANVAALKSATPQRAVAWTIFFVLLLPRLFLFVMGDAVYFLAVGLLARRYVRRNFRRLVSEGI